MTTRFSTSMRVYNSLSKSIETLTTASKGTLNWYPQALTLHHREHRYACGPTVYDDCHIGHARYIACRLRNETDGRSYICMDVIRRTIEHFEPTLKVRLLMGITDIDDKIINRANAQGKSIKEIASMYEQDFTDSLQQLNVDRDISLFYSSKHM